MNADKNAILLHAPSRASLARARSNALNIRRDRPHSRIEIVVNAGGVAAALDEPHETDHLLVFCSNTLAATGVSVADGVTVVPGAVLHLADRQAEGWVYIRS